MTPPLLARLASGLAPALVAVGLCVLVGSRPVDDPTLTADRAAVSVSAGGTVELTLDLGPELARKRYLVGGSASGSFPGALHGIVRVPLNMDAYTTAVLGRVNSACFVGFSGHLDGQGRAKARLVMPATARTGLAGRVYHHAAAVFDPSTGEVIEATNPVEVLLLP